MRDSISEIYERAPAQFSHVRPARAFPECDDSVFSHETASLITVSQRADFAN